MNTEKNGTHNRGIGDEIIRLRDAGLSYRDIAKKLNCSKSTINFHCKKHDKTDTGMKVYPIEQETKKEIKEYTKEHTKREAMLKFEVSRTTVKRYKNKTQ
jgi:transposase